MKKKFDCLEMKTRLQREMLAKEARGESSAPTRKAWLETGQDSLAVWWRALGAPVPATPKFDEMPWVLDSYPPLRNYAFL